MSGDCCASLNCLRSVCFSYLMAAKKKKKKQGIARLSEMKGTKQS